MHAWCSLTLFVIARVYIKDGGSCKDNGPHGHRRGPGLHGQAGSCVDEHRPRGSQEDFVGGAVSLSPAVLIAVSSSVLSCVCRCLYTVPRTPVPPQYCHLLVAPLFLVIPICNSHTIVLIYSLSITGDRGSRGGNMRFGLVFLLFYHFAFRNNFACASKSNSICFGACNHPFIGSY